MRESSVMSAFSSSSIFRKQYKKQNENKICPSSAARVRGERAVEETAPPLLPLLRFPLPSYRFSKCLNRRKKTPSYCTNLRGFDRCKDRLRDPFATACATRHQTHVGERRLTMVVGHVEVRARSNRSKERHPRRFLAWIVPGLLPTPRKRVDGRVTVTVRGRGMKGSLLRLVGY